MVNAHGIEDSLLDCCRIGAGLGRLGRWAGIESAAREFASNALGRRCGVGVIIGVLCIQAPFALLYS